MPTSVAVLTDAEESTDICFARRLVMERLPEARELIPKGYGTPTLGPISTGLGEIYQFEVRGDGYSPMDLRSILDWQIAFRLRSAPGVVEVNSYGGELKTYEIQLDPNLLVSHRVSLDMVFDALRDNNANTGGAYIERAQEQYVIRGEGLINKGPNGWSTSMWPGTARAAPTWGWRLTATAGSSRSPLGA